MTGDATVGALRSPLAYELRLILKDRGYRLLAVVWALLVAVTFFQTGRDQPLVWLQGLTADYLPLLAPVTLLLAVAVFHRERRLAGGDWWDALPYQLVPYFGLRLAALTVLLVLAPPALPLLLFLTSAGVGAPAGLVAVVYAGEWLAALLVATALGAAAAAAFTATLAAGGVGLVLWGAWLTILGWLPLSQGRAGWALLAPHAAAFPGRGANHLWGFAPYEAVELLRHGALVAAALLVLAVAARAWRPRRFPRRLMGAWTVTVALLAVLMGAGTGAQSLRLAALAPLVVAAEEAGGGAGVLAALAVPLPWAEAVHGPQHVETVRVALAPLAPDGTLQVTTELRLERGVGPGSVWLLLALAPESEVGTVTAECGAAQVHRQGLVAAVQLDWHGQAGQSCQVELETELADRRLVRHQPAARPIPVVWWDRRRLLLPSGTFWRPVPLAAVGEAGERLVPHSWGSGVAPGTLVDGPRLAVVAAEGVRVVYAAGLGSPEEAVAAAGVVERADAFLARMVPSPRHEDFTLYVLPEPVPLLVEGTGVLPEHHWRTFVGLAGEPIPPLGGLELLDALILERWFPVPSPLDAEDLAVRRAGARTLELIYLREAGQTELLQARRAALQARANDAEDPLEARSAEVALLLLERYRGQGAAGVFSVLAPAAAGGQERALRFADLPLPDDR